jgi:hypothetical protein
MTRPPISFQLGDAITGEPQLYVSNPPAPAEDSAAEARRGSQPAACNPLKQFATVIGGRFRVGPAPEDALAAALGRIFRT